MGAYPVESIFAEKLETAITRADQNSRMKDYHDLLLLIRGNVMDKKAVKSAIKATFTNRETNLKKLFIPKNQIDNIQKYWGIYLKALDSKIQKDLSHEIQTVMDEINKYLESEIL